MLLEPSNEIIEGVRQTVGVNGKQLQEALQMLRQWLERQPHLPQEIENGRLEQMFLRCKASLERTKKVLDTYYSLRNILPEILCDRDPEAPWFARAIKQQMILPLPKLTDDYSRVTLLRLESPDPETFAAFDFVKLLFMIEDVRLFEDYFASDIVVIDLKSTSLTLAAKWTLPILKKFSMCCEEGYSTRMKMMHFVNAPQGIEPLINIGKAILKPKLAAKIHMHYGGIESLYDILDRKILPEEYGGNAGSIHNIWAGCQKKLLSYRNWFLEQENVKADESKRPTKKVSRCDLFGFEGSFRTLSLD